MMTALLDGIDYTTNQASTDMQTLFNDLAIETPLAARGFGTSQSFHITNKLSEVDPQVASPRRYHPVNRAVSRVRRRADR